MKSAFHLLRYVDHDSPIHRMNARTKVSGITIMAACLAFRPGWIALGVIWSLGFVTMLVARLPWTVVPRFPKIVGYGLLISFFFASLSGGEPNLQVGDYVVGLGGLALQTRFTLVTFGLLFLSLLLGWTTSPADLPGAARFLLQPFRFIRIPVDEIVAGLALAIRVMPLLMDELTMTLTLWRSRREASKASRVPAATPAKSADDSDGERPDSFEQVVNDAVNVAAVATTSAVRRATEAGVAMRAKGSIHARVSPTTWSYIDALAAVILIGVTAFIFSFDR